MKFNPDDPRLTAYALGELDETERQEVEALLKESPEARRAVEEARQTATLLTEEMKKETCPELTAERRAVLINRLQEESRKIVPFFARRWVFVTSLSAAAAAIAVAFVFSSLSSSQRAVGPTALSNYLRKLPLPESRAEWGQQPASSSQPQPPTALDEISEPMGKIISSASSSKQTEEPPSVRLRDLGPLNAPTKPNVQVFRGSKSSYTIVDDKPEGGSVPPRDKEVASESGLVPSAPRGTDVGGSLSAGVAGQTDERRLRLQLPAARGGGETGGISGSGHPEEKTRNYRYAWKDDKRRLRDLVEEGTSFGESNLGRPVPSLGTESYERLTDNPYYAVSEHPLSTFSIDVDTASYANVRRFLNEGQWPPRDAVRIEEMINYFPYQYDSPRGSDPFAVYLEVGPCPWNPGNRLARIGIKGKEISNYRRPQCNLVFLIDVSGSMEPANKLPLIKRAMRLLVEQLTEDDRVAIITYAGNAGVALSSTSADQKDRILAALDSLEASGSTNGGEGIQMAYDLAVRNFRRGGVNRVILCTDGDFNVGITDQGDLTRLIEAKAKTGVFLSVLGFGMGNLKDSTMEKLADKGNGNYAYIDNLDEAHKVLEEQLTGTLVTIAKDVKVQIEFNPAYVQGYRLIGYENRLLRTQDFHNDRKDAGEVGAGHTVTALYEIVPTPRRSARLAPDGLKYRRALPTPTPPYADELLTLKLRYKLPNADTSRLMEFPARDRDVRIGEASNDFRFTAAVAEFGMILRDSPYRGNATIGDVLELAQQSCSYDPNGCRTEFIELVKKANDVK